MLMRTGDWGQLGHPGLAPVNDTWLMLNLAYVTSRYAGGRDRAYP